MPRLLLLPAPRYIYPRPAGKLIMHIPILSSGIEDSLPDGIDLPKISSATAAGIGVAIAGNVLISLALNCQKLAHRRLEREREAAAQAPQPLLPTHSDGRAQDGSQHGDPTPATPIPAIAVVETAPLLEHAHGAEAVPRRPGRRWLFFRRPTARLHAKEADRAHLASTHALMPVDVVTVRTDGSSPRSKKPERQDVDSEESNYLKSKLWYVKQSLYSTRYIQPVLGGLGSFS